MGCWMGALGRLTIVPEPDNDLIKEYVYFSEHICPNSWISDSIPFVFAVCAAGAVKR